VVFGQAFWSEGLSGGGLDAEASAPVGEVGRSQKWAPFFLDQAFRSERPSGGWLETEASAPVGEVGQSWKAGAAPPRPGLPVDDWIALLARRSDTWAGP